MATLTDEVYQKYIASYMGANWNKNVGTDYAAAVSSGLLDNTITRIARTEIAGVDAVPKVFQKWIKTDVAYGDFIQSYKILRTQGQRFDPKAEDTDDFKMYEPEVLSQYAKKNDRPTFPITLWDVDFKKIFTGPQGYDEFRSMIIGSVSESSNRDYENKFKTYISQPDVFGGTGSIVSMPFLTDPSSFEGTLETLLDNITDFTDDKFIENKGEYNKLADETATTLEGRADILMRRKDIKNIKRKIRAKIFNPEMLNLTGNIMPVSDFATLPDGREIIAIVCDDRQFGYYPELAASESVRNTTRDRTNIFLKKYGMYTGSLFRNIVYIVNSATPGVTNITSTDGDFPDGEIEPMKSSIYKNTDIESEE